MPYSGQQVCQNCVYWTGGVSYTGDCRRYPKTLVAQSGGGYSSAFPTTTAADWCGEFKDKNRKPGPRSAQ